MADLTITSKQVRNDLLHPCVISTYLINTGETIAVGDVVSIATNKVTKATTETTSLGIALDAGTATGGDAIRVIRHGGAKLSTVTYNALAVTQAVYETLMLNGLFLS